MNDIGLIDTNIVILLEHLDPTELPNISKISAITLAELAVGPLATSDPHEQGIRQRRLINASSDLEALPFNEEVAMSYAQVSADLRNIGRKSKARNFDALIAATAIANKLPLYTTNPEDFKGISGLAVHKVTRPIIED